MLSRWILVLLVTTLLSGHVWGQSTAAVRLYVLDAGSLESDPGRYQLTREEVRATQLAVTAFLVVHPKGTLMWDTGGVPDDSWTPGGAPVTKRVFLSDSRERPITVRRSITAQLAAAGYDPDEITYLALSHHHWDHTANANLFAASTWLVPGAERDAMFPREPAGVVQPSTFARLRASPSVDVGTDTYDVFGDGTVLLLPTPGHTRGHQALYVKLENTGGVVLSGDLYHYPEERSLSRLPTAEANVEDTRTSRQWLEAFLARTGAQLWIQHDFTAAAEWRKAPEYYD